MGIFGQVISILGAIFPSWVIVVALGFLAVALVIIIIKIVAFVLDAIPFL